MEKDGSKPAPAKQRKGTAARKQRRRRPEEEIETYRIAIDDWSWDFTFGQAFDRLSAAPHADYRHLTVKGHLLDMPRVKADAVELTFMPDSRLNPGAEAAGASGPAGGLHLWRGTLAGLLSMPMDILPSLLTMLIGERLRFVTLTGARLRYGRAQVRHYRLAMVPDDEGDDD